MTQSREMVDKDTRSSLDRENPHRQNNNNYKQQSRQSSYTEDGDDDLCVDDDEEDADEDDLEREDPVELHQYNKKTESELYEMTVDSRKVDQAFDFPKDDTFFSAHDSQRTIMQ